MTKAAQQSEWKKGTCRWCDKKGEVYRNNGLCDDCDSRVIHCTICKQDQHEDSHCRHVFDRMDRRDVESDHRVQRGLAGVHELLRDAAGGDAAEAPPVAGRADDGQQGRAGVERPGAAERRLAGPAAALVEAADGSSSAPTATCSTRRARRLDRPGVRGDGAVAATHVPGADQARGADAGLPLPNVWLGVSVEDQARADERIPHLLDTLAAVRFISAEPLLGPIDLRHIAPTETGYINALCSSTGPNLDQVIAGGESGPNARPVHPDWARSLRDQCAAADVAFFFKQWGEWAPGENVERATGIVETADWFDGRWTLGRENLADNEGHVDDEPDVYRIGKKRAGALLDGREHREFPR
jgi:hypothetical protein